MNFTNSFTAIDFLTAQGSNYSICQVGIVRVEDGKVVKKLDLLVQPPKNAYWNDYIIKNKITPEMTKDSPTFDKIWYKIEPYIKGQNVVSHNMDFDLKYLKHTLKYYSIHMPEFNKICTYTLYNKQSLRYLCDFYKVVLFYNTAIAKAMACAKLYLIYLENKGI